jgi:hypothetical protein
MPVQLIRKPTGGSGAQFNEQELVGHLKAHFRDYIIQGQQNCSLLKHTKPNSLDYWLRTNFAKEPDTKQAVNEVIDQLVATGKFAIIYGLACPDSGRPCKGLKLISKT